MTAPTPVSASAPPRIALIHALPHSVEPINAAFEAQWPDALRMNLLDDSLSADLARSGAGLDAAMHDRFLRLADYAVGTGAQALLFTCSAFGPCIRQWGAGMRGCRCSSPTRPWWTTSRRPPGPVLAKGPWA